MLNKDGIETTVINVLLLHLTVRFLFNNFIVLET